MNCRPLLVLLLLASPFAMAAEPLPKLNIQPDSLTVSGVSSGGYMAVQFQVAYAKDVQGAGIIAAGPWFCAQDTLDRAMNECLHGQPAGPDVGPLVAKTREAAAAKRIDDPSWLSPDRVWMFHGARDTRVGAAVTDSLLRYYKAFLPVEQVHYETQVAAGHGFPTLATGGACDGTASPWLNSCDFDAAGQMLNHLYDGLATPDDTAPAGELREFDQHQAAGDGVPSLDQTGLVYLPKACLAGEPCRIHVAFHGCRQGAGFIGRAFAEGAGYNRWADANNIAVLYPQVKKSMFSPFNPQGCWDWWGYGGSNYALRDGAQLLAVHRMLQALGAR